jgi:monoamine oxidase
VLLGFLDGEAARTLGAAPAVTRRSAVLEVFGRLFGEEALRPERFVERS